MREIIPPKVEQGFQSVFLLFVRVYWGWLFLEAGLGKWKDIARPIGFFTSLGIPLPQLSAYTVASIELVGGALLIVGLLARPAAAALVMVMAGAYYFAHFEQLMSIFSDPRNFASVGAFAFLFAALIVLLFGAGWVSVDYFLCKRKR